MILCYSSEFNIHVAILPSYFPFQVFFSLKLILRSDNSFGVIISVDNEAFQVNVPKQEVSETIGSLLLTCVGFDLGSEGCSGEAQCCSCEVKRYKIQDGEKEVCYRSVESCVVCERCC